MFFVRLKWRPNEWVMQRNPSSPSAASFEVAFERACCAKKTQEVRLQSHLLSRLDVHVVQRKTREDCLQSHLYSCPDAPFQISIILVSSGRPLMAIRTTSDLPVFFVKTSLRPDEFASRPDALNLFRVL
jgi:hypothetical protein